MLLHRAVLAVVSAVLVLAPALPAAAAPAPAAARATPAAAPPHGADYVALGDSYAAGYGLSGATGEPAAACGQSSEDYPHRVATAFDLDLTDVTCAGATSADVVDTRQNGVAPQSHALSAATRIVTLTIGGNDADLFATASSCLALSRTGPVVSGSNAASCRAEFTKGGTDALAAKIAGPVTSGITAALRAVHAVAPRAHVFVIGYPTIFPDAAHIPSGGCFRPLLSSELVTGRFPANAFPFTDTDVRYLHGVQVDLDDALRDAARAAGGVYVDTLDGSAAHSACSTSDPYVKGVHLTATSGFRDVTLVPGSLHPNRAGASFLASRASAAIRAEYARIAAEERARAAASASASASAAASASASAQAAARTEAAHLRAVIGWVVVALVLAAIGTAVSVIRVRRRRRADGRDVDGS